MTSDDGAEKDVGLELSMGPCGEIEPFGEMWDNGHSYRDSYSPGFTEVSEAQPALASGYKPDNALERSWQQLGAKPLQQFWEHGFWGEILAMTLMPLHQLLLQIRWVYIDRWCLCLQVRWSC